MRHGPSTLRLIRSPLGVSGSRRSDQKLRVCLNAEAGRRGEKAQSLKRGSGILEPMILELARNGHIMLRRYGLVLDEAGANVFQQAK